MVIEGFRMIFDRNHRHLLDRRAEFMHVSLNHHGVVSAVESADGEVKVRVGGEGNELVPLPGVHTRHRFKPEGQATIHETGCHRFPRRMETEAACGYSAFASFRGLWTASMIIV